MVAMPVQEEDAPHLLVLSYPAQGHINPARQLALCLLRATGARVTVCTAASACRRMFPDGAEEHVDSAGVRYFPYQDSDMDQTDYMAQLRLLGPRALAAVLARLRDAGSPATLVMYTVLLSWVPEVARGHGVPAVPYWIQSATTLAVYFHFLHGAGAKASADDPVRVPGLPAPLQPRDLPSFLLSGSNTATDAFVLSAFRELFDTLGRDREHSPTVLANTFDAMEPEAVATLRQQGLRVVPVGPFMGMDAAPNTGTADLFRQDDKGYLEWLDARPAGSVVYISFGSMSVMSERQIAEVSRGMADNGRPYLWVLRKDNPRPRGEDVRSDAGADAGLVVGWCDQGKVLSHPAVGCFVTHCGWNSTLESVACGVPVVGVPQWTDQGTNAWLVQQMGTGVRAAVSDEDGVLDAAELRRCLGLAMSEGMRAKAALWKEKARAAALESERNLKAAFVALAN